MSHTAKSDLPASMQDAAAAVRAVLDTKHPVTTDLIVEWSGRILPALAPDASTDPALVTRFHRYLESQYNVWVANVTEGLGDDSDHVPWLDLRKSSAEWHFWDRYESFLRSQTDTPPLAIKRLDEFTDDVLSRIEAPDRPSAWDRRGLVVGNVQSGKTSNYIGLIAKALDSGYKLVVVLAGLHNSLRSQTQFRIDEGILGFDTSRQLKFESAGDARIGVGTIGGRNLPVNSFTSSTEKGDFNLTIASQLGVKVGGNDPIVLVVKKNKSILENLHRWATGLSHEIDPDTGRKVVRNVPVLVIDDESDNASVDTSSPKRGQDPDEVNPTTINRLIRDFLNTFEQTAYVAYTATPFANIFISKDKVHEEVGADLFPRSFIVSISPPSNYVGPSRVFGLDANQEYGIESVEALPILRDVDDYEEWLPNKHKKGEVLDDALPETLVEAVIAFLIASAVRASRGQGAKHNSMLIHVTRFTDVQKLVGDQVADLLDTIRNRLTYGEGANPEFRTLIEQIFVNDFVATTQTMTGMDGVNEMVGQLPTVDQLFEILPSVAESTHVRLINGTSDDVLEYRDNPGGVNVIAIGGDKLSRGLTLEGLTVSYYLRASRMYDTLMQMGRWFGYRPNYLDVCRLYTTPELQSWYSFITGANQELQAEFEAMARLKKTPDEFGLRVRQHPSGLMVTSPTKQRNARSLKISYAGTIAETLIFDKRKAVSNWEHLALTTSRLTHLSSPEEANVAWLWRDVDSQEVVDFLNGYGADDGNIKAMPKILANYIRAQRSRGELTSWTIALLNSSFKEARSVPLGDLTVRLTQREPLEKAGDPRRNSIKRLVSPSHELLDLDRKSLAWHEALAETVVAWEAAQRPGQLKSAPTEPYGRHARTARPSHAGLLMIYPLDDRPFVSAHQGEVLDGETPLLGFAISFPSSPTAVPVDYKVNETYWTNEFVALESEAPELGIAP